MRTALETNTWYCHAFCKIPKVQLIQPLNDKEGELELEMFRLAENQQQSTTHRQMQLEQKRKKPSSIFNDVSARTTKDTRRDHSD